MNAFTQQDLHDLGTSTVGECKAFIADEETYSVVSAVLEQYFDRPTIERGGLTEASNQLAHVTPPGFLVLDLADSDEPLTDVLSIISAFGGEARVIAIGTVNDINFYREMIEAGLTDYLVKPITEKSLAMAIERAQTPAEDTLAVAREQTQVVAVLGARGGVGTSALSVSIAWILAEEQKRRTALIDLDLEFGTVALSLDLEPTHGLREALENPARMDSLFISSAMEKVSERLSVLATEETMAGDVDLNPAAIDILFDALARNHECIVVDLPRSAVGFRNRVLKLATHVILVTDLTLASLRDSIRLLSMAEENAGGTPITVIANRAGGKHGAMSKADFQKTLGRQIDYLLPEDRKALKQAADTGKPLPVAAKSSRMVGGIRDIARKIAPAKGKAGKSRALWRWSKKDKAA